MSDVGSESSRSVSLRPLPFQTKFSLLYSKTQVTRPPTCDDKLLRLPLLAIRSCSPLPRSRYSPIVSERLLKSITIVLLQPNLRFILLARSWIWSVDWHILICVALRTVSSDDMSSFVYNAHSLPIVADLIHKTSANVAP